MRKVFAATLVVLVLSTRADAIWENNGNAACTNGATQQSPSLVLDAAGGIIVFWKDDRSTPSHIYAQRYSPDGDPLWSTNGVLVTNPSREQTEPRAVSDGVRGAIVCYVQDQAITDDIKDGKMTRFQQYVDTAKLQDVMRAR